MPSATAPSPSSTSGRRACPASPAKPIIDIDVTVADPRDESTYVPGLEAAGFRLRIREPAGTSTACSSRMVPACNVHVFGPDTPELVRHRMLRDWLIEHPDDRERYAAAKRDVGRRVERRRREP